MGTLGSKSYGQSILIWIHGPLGMYKKGGSGDLASRKAVDL